MFGVLPRLLDFPDTYVARIRYSTASCIRESMVRFRWESLRIPCIRLAADAVATVVHRFRGKKNQGIGVRSLYEKWEKIRRHDVVRVGDHQFTIAITICGIAIGGVSGECTRRLLVHAILQLYITRDSPESCDHSPRPGLQPSDLHRLLDGGRCPGRASTLDATLQDNVFIDVSVPFMLAM